MRSLLVVAPHPDDETIAAHGLISRLRQRGVAVRVLVVSDGAASHPASLAWPRRRLTGERERETRCAMRRIGVSASAIDFLRLPDGALHSAAAAVRRGIARAVAASRRPALVLSPSLTDAHPDHRATAAGVNPVRGPGVRRLAYPVWPAGARQRRAHVLTLTPRERLAKRFALRGYRTQTGRITDDPNGFAMTPAQIAAFSRTTEQFLDPR